jgi:hypothetical protein
MLSVGGYVSITDEWAAGLLTRRADLKGGKAAPVKTSDQFFTKHSALRDNIAMVCFAFLVLLKNEYVYGNDN